MRSLFDSNRGAFNIGGFAAFIVIIVIVLYVSNVQSKECTKDAQCGDNKYCGADFSCHQIPIITINKTEVKNDYLKPSAILGFSIVIAALILKKRQ